MSDAGRRQHAAPSSPDPRADMLQRGARRREARRRRRLARIDLVLGAAVALLVLLLSPGLAIAGLIALLVLAACVASLVLERRRRSRPQARSGRARSYAAVRASDGGAGPLARDRAPAARSRERT
jgi:peptidoglycan/LPS O-acetylase OafA/YrhL